MFSKVWYTFDLPDNCRALARADSPKRHSEIRLGASRKLDQFQPKSCHETALRSMCVCLCAPALGGGFPKLQNFRSRAAQELGAHT